MSKQGKVSSLSFAILFEQRHSIFELKDSSIKSLYSNEWNGYMSEAQLRHIHRSFDLEIQLYSLMEKTVHFKWYH